MELDYRPRHMALWDPWLVVAGDTVHLFHQQGRIDPGSDRDSADCDAIGHAVSRDLVHWEECEPVLRPGRLPRERSHPPANRPDTAESVGGPPLLVAPFAGWER